MEVWHRKFEKLAIVMSSKQEVWGASRKFFCKEGLFQFPPTSRDRQHLSSKDLTTTCMAGGGGGEKRIVPYLAATATDRVVQKPEGKIAEEEEKAGC